MKAMFLSLVFALSAIAANAAPVVKYSGDFDFPPGGIHRQPVKGTWTLTVDGENLTEVYMKPTAAVVGKTEFKSTEQTAYSKAHDKAATMAIIFKLQGPTHQWSYVYVGETTDAGKNYGGTFYKATGTTDNIKSVLDSGNLSTWKNVGAGTLKEN